MRGARSIALAAIACGCVGPDVTGHACIVFDIRNPGRCAAAQDVGGLSVLEAESGAHTTTDADGAFVMNVPQGVPSPVLRVAYDREDRVTSLIGLDSARSGDVLTPVITTALWATYRNALHAPPDDPALAAVHVSLGLPGIAVGSIAVAGATQILYNQGDPFNWLLQPPGDQTPAILAFGVPADRGTAMVTLISRTDKVLFDGEVPVEPGAITWLRVEP